MNSFSTERVTEDFIQFLKEYPDTDRAGVLKASTFLWTIPSGNKNNTHGQADWQDFSAVLSSFPNVGQRGYFGPQGKAPTDPRVKKLTAKN